MSEIARTARLHLRVLDEDDAELMLAVLTDAAFIRYVGDRGVRDLDGARAYIRERILPHQAEHGCSVYRVGLHDGTAVGLCGLVCRPELPCPDLGFACPEPHRRRGYMREASRAVMDHARSDLGLDELCAVVAPDHTASIRLLESLGLHRSGSVRLDGEDLDLHLFRMAL